MITYLNQGNVIGTQFFFNTQSWISWNIRFDSTQLEHWHYLYHILFLKYVSTQQKMSSAFNPSAKYSRWNMNFSPTTNSM